MNKAAHLILFMICLVWQGKAQTSFETDYIKWSDYAFEGYGINGGPDGNGSIKGRLDYRIYYSTGNSAFKLRKPIIIIDGFDPQDRRRITDYDCWADGNCNKHFFKPLEQKLYQTFKDRHKSIADMMSYGGAPIIPKLRDEGFDVVVVNFPTYTASNGAVIDGGADFIERNALTLASLINELNTRVAATGSNEKLVVVGPSMGGQISRYALAWMEKMGMDHNTRLWISIDSPHLGANIPIGIQSLVHIMATILDNGDAKDFYFNQLKSIAAQQQLIEQHLPFNNHAHLNNGSPIRKKYMNNLTSNGLAGSGGYPMNLRKIAIANGSLTGMKVGREGEEDFRIHGFIDGPFGIGKIKVAELNTTYMPAYNQQQDVARLFRQAKPRRIANYKNLNPNGSMDVAPGGLFDSEDILYKSALGGAPGILSGGGFLFQLGLGFFGIINDDLEGRTNKMVHSFIPTVSALGFKNPNFNWNNRINRDLVCSGEIPFDSYYGPKINEPHTSFTVFSFNWMMHEVKGFRQYPTVYITNGDLSGPTGNLCEGQTATYSIPSCPPRNTSWTVSSNLTIVTQTNRSVTVRAKSGRNGAAYVQVTTANSILKKQFSVGVPSPLISFENTSICVGQILQDNLFFVPASPGATSYRLTSLNSNLSINGNSTFTSPNPPIVNFMSNMAGLYPVKLETFSSCGTGSTVFYIEAENCSGGGGIGLYGTDPDSDEQLKTDVLFSVYPNPSTDKIHVRLTHFTEEGSNTPASVKIYNLSGRVVFEQSDLYNEIKIDVADFTEDLYHLEVKFGNETHREKIKIVR